MLALFPLFFFFLPTNSAPGWGKRAPISYDEPDADHHDRNIETDVDCALFAFLFPIWDTDTDLKLAAMIHEAVPFQTRRQSRDRSRPQHSPRSPCHHGDNSCQPPSWLELCKRPDNRWLAMDGMASAVHPALGCLVNEETRPQGQRVWPAAQGPWAQPHTRPKKTIIKAGIWRVAA